MALRSRSADRHQASPVAGRGSPVSLRGRSRRAVLIVHLVCSVGWIGAALAYLVLGLVAARSVDPSTYTAMWTSMELIGWRALIPLAIGTLVSGVALSLLTSWGLLQHYWVVTSLLLTAVATGVLLQHMLDVRAVAEDLRDGTLLDHPGGDFGHTVAGITLLLSVHTLNVLKPRGLTRRGWRKQRARRGVAQPPSETSVPA